MILLSTYNGARFLRQQLASFERQTAADWRLVWRDDGSTDDTLAIMEEFSARTKRCTWIKNPPERLGPTDSFLVLLKEVGRNIGIDDIIVFSDQDDIWLSEKLEKAKEKLMESRNNLPKLYFARQKLIDENNKVIGESAKIRFLPSFTDSLAQNVAAGCTIALNDKAVKLVNESCPPKETYHDWWCYIVVSACGGWCIYDNEPVILYRQHSANAIGAQSSVMSRAIKAIRRGSKRFMTVFTAHVEALSKNQTILTPSSKQNIELIHNNLNRRFLLFIKILNMRIRRQNIMETFIFYVWIVFG